MAKSVEKKFIEAKLNTMRVDDKYSFTVGSLNRGFEYRDFPKIRFIKDHIERLEKVGKRFEMEEFSIKNITLLVKRNR